MKEFTFCSFTYNQEKYIIQQLESIKYQIETYGDGISCRYLLTDDGSKDGTVKAVRDWIANNDDLFDSVEFQISETNHGIVRNYENALKHIHTEHFKILAGDDLYYKNNIFDIYKTSNFVISPIVSFTDDGSAVSSNDRMIRKLLAYNNDSEKIKSTILRLFKYTGGLPAPGIFLTSSLIDNGLYDLLAYFSWIEDVPEWYYLLNKSDTCVSVITTPLIAYRADVGISQRPSHPGFLKDLELLNKMIHIRKRNGSKYLNPYYYMRAIELKLTDCKQFIDPEYRKSIKELNEAEEAFFNDGYIREILRRAES